LASVGVKMKTGGYASTSRSVLKDVSKPHSTGKTQTATPKPATAASAIRRASSRALRSRNMSHDTRSVMPSSTIASDAP
jgi:hypothetical protein